MAPGSPFPVPFPGCCRSPSAWSFLRRPERSHPPGPHPEIRQTAHSGAAKKRKTRSRPRKGTGSGKPGAGSASVPGSGKPEGSPEKLRPETGPWPPETAGQPLDWPLEASVSPLPWPYKVPGYNGPLPEGRLPPSWKIRKPPVPAGQKPSHTSSEGSPADSEGFHIPEAQRSDTGRREPWPPGWKHSREASGISRGL